MLLIFFEKTSFTAYSEGRAEPPFSQFSLFNFLLCCCCAAAEFLETALEILGPVEAASPSWHDDHLPELKGIEFFDATWIRRVFVAGLVALGMFARDISARASMSLNVS